MTESNIMEISATRSVSGDAFTRGLMDFPFTIGAPSAWTPAKSYFRVEMELLGIGDTQPIIKEQLAFADDAVSCLFNNCYMRAGGQSASQINQYLPQGSALKKRLSKTQPWLKSLGKDAFMSEADFGKRCLAVSADAVPSTGLGAQTDIYSIANATHFHDCTAAISASTVTTTPVTIGVAAVGTNTDSVLTVVNATITAEDVGNTIVVGGIPYIIKTLISATTATLSTPTATAVGATSNFYLIRRNLKRTHEGRNRVYALWVPPIGFFDHDGYMGAGDYSIQLTTSADYKFAAVESRNPQFATIGQYSLNILDVKLYIHTEKVSIPDKTNLLHMTECEVQSKPYSTNLQFSVPASTKSITIFTQASVAGSDPRYPPSMFKAENDTDLNLRTLQVSYGGMTKTITPWSSEFGVNSPVGRNSNLLMQRYHDSLREAGLNIDALGCESFDDWLKRGCFFHFSFERDINNLATNLQIMSNFTPALSANTELFVASWYTKTTSITTQNGSVVSVESISV